MALRPGEQGEPGRGAQTVRVEFPDAPIKLVWDGVPYHRAHVVREAAQTLEIGLIFDSCNEE